MKSEPARGLRFIGIRTRGPVFIPSPQPIMKQNRTMGIVNLPGFIRCYAGKLKVNADQRGFTLQVSQFWPEPDHYFTVEETEKTVMPCQVGSQKVSPYHLQIVWPNQLLAQPQTKYWQWRTFISCHPRRGPAPGSSNGQTTPAGPEFCNITATGQQVNGFPSGPASTWHRWRSGDQRIDRDHCNCCQ